MSATPTRTDPHGDPYARWGILHEPGPDGQCSYCGWHGRACPRATCLACGTRQCDHGNDCIECLVGLFRSADPTGRPRRQHGQVTAAWAMISAPVTHRGYSHPAHSTSKSARRTWASSDSATYLSCWIPCGAADRSRAAKLPGGSDERFDED